MELTAGAMETISEYYSELRASSATLPLPITVRTLETIIRLSTAAAKARMSEEGVEQVSVTAACRYSCCFMQSCCLQLPACQHAFCMRRTVSEVAAIKSTCKQAEKVSVAQEHNERLTPQVC